MLPRLLAFETNPPMQRVLLLLSSLLSLTALGVVLLRGESEPPPPPAPPPATDTALELTRLGQRVRAVEAELEVLRGRGVPAGSAAAAPGAAAPAPAALAEEVADLLSLQAGEAMTGPEGRQYLKELMKEAQAEVGRERQQARLQEAAADEQTQKAERAERWRRFVTEASLSWSQEQELKGRLEAEDKLRDELYQKLRDGQVQFPELRQRVSAAREETNAAMAKALSAEQKAKFDATREAERSPRGGGGGPRR